MLGGWGLQAELPRFIVLVTHWARALAKVGDKLKPVWSSLIKSCTLTHRCVGPEKEEKGRLLSNKHKNTMYSPSSVSLRLYLPSGDIKKKFTKNTLWTISSSGIRKRWTYHILHSWGALRVKQKIIYLISYCRNPGKKWCCPGQGKGGRNRSDWLAERFDTGDVIKRGENERGSLNYGLATSKGGEVRARMTEM